MPFGPVLACCASSQLRCLARAGACHYRGARSVSYDIGIGDFDANYTWNLGALFYDHIPAAEEGGRGGLHTLAGMTGKQALAALDAAFERIHSTHIKANSVRPFREKYDAKNGWGDTDGALIFLARLMAACARNPRKKVWLWT